MSDTIVPPPVDLPLEQRRIRHQSVLAALLCVVVISAAIFLLPFWIAFPVDQAERIAFALRADVLLVVNVMVGVRWVSSTRYHSAEDSAGSAYAPPSAILKVPAAFLQNTLEQAIIMALALLALTTIEGDYPLAYIIAAVLLFIIGRITFARGYRAGAGGRAFGMATTALPSVGAIVWLIVDIGSRLITSL